MRSLRVNNSPKRKRKRLQIRKKIDKVLRFLQWKKHQRKFFKNVIIGIILALFLHLFLPVGVKPASTKYLILIFSSVRPK